jgi:VCBS repeat-containing protein
MATHNGTSGNDYIDGGNGTDSIYGLGGDDIIYGGNGGDTLDGGDGNDQLFGENGNEHLFGGAGDDLIDGNSGFDTAYYSGLIRDYTFLASAGYLHIRHLGGAGPDGYDRVIRVERLVFADRIVELGSGRNIPVAVDDQNSIGEDGGTLSSGPGGVLANDFDFDGDAMSVTAGTFVGAYGTLTLNSDGTYSYALSASAQALALGQSVQDSFDYVVSDNDGSDTGTLVITVAGLNDAPVANADSIQGGENEVVLADVLANDSDVDDGAVLTVTAASAPAGQGSASVADNQVRFDPGGDFESLAAGESVDVAIGYDIADEHGATASAILTVTVAGANDAPVANPETDTTSENMAIPIDVLANDTDVDNGAVLTVASASAPVGQGSASAVGNQVEFDPGTDFDDLAVGQSEEVVVSYAVEDEHGASASSTVTIIVTGTNDAPVANPDSRTTSENSAVVVDVLANDDDPDNEAVLIVTAASGPAGKGSVTIVENEVRFDPGGDFDHLAAGDSEIVVISYTIEDEFGVQASSTATITVQGRDEGVVGVGTEDSDTLIGTPGDDTLDALGGDDTVFGLGGDDLIFGGSGNDFLNGEDDNDIVDGGSGEDVLSGGEGNDELLGQAGSDNLAGENGDDLLSGGAGFDQLFGDSGEDRLEGGADEDFMSGGDDDDVLLGQAGNDSLIGGQGDDDLDGGDGDDSLSDFSGTNSLAGGIGQDFILAGSADGAQTIDGGDGDDTIRHYYRSFASTVTTGAGSDSIEIAHADVGTAAIVVTDFTPGAGGDRFRLSGEDGSLLGLLSGWDGSSNPFGSGFLRLQQDGADTLFQWDRDGAGTDSDWETLAVFENSDSGDFTDANFEPGYHPDGSTPAGETITGTEEGETLIGTIGADTIDALGGDDSVSGLAGADLIRGGDGSDQLYGGADGDVVEGGNDDDFLSGGDGNDLLSGQAGNDNVVGENGDDQLSGGDGDDSLSDLAGVNGFAGGIGNDFIVAGASDGAQTIDGGDGNDTIRHYYRSFAGTITTGSGIDSIELLNADVGTAAIVVTDFTAGSGGDVVRLSGEGSILGLLTGWDGSSNPFGSGFLRLQQSGADTVLQWDRDGSASGSDWETLMVFEDSDMGDFTGANFEPGYHPDGTPLAGQTITGTAGDDNLVGTDGADTINALAGNDFVAGGSGADSLNAGDGSDQAYGDSGNDVIDGGNDDDLLSGGDGNDQLLGQAGADSLDGGLGDDQLSGGDGDDTLSDLAGVNGFTGGVGNDFIVAGSSDGVQTIDAGDGNDTIRYYYRSFAGAITTGSGSDSIELLHANVGTAAVVVTDFTAGGGGDVVRLAGDEGSLLNLLSGWDGSSNPFGSGFLRLQQSGTDTLLQWDQDGSASGSGWETLMVFEGSDMGDFTGANFEPGYDPDGSALAGQTITGTAGDDSLAGTGGPDTINALAGSDFVAGGSGGDQINGGDGFDQAYGDSGDDVVDGGNHDDLLSGGDGNDQLLGQAGNDALSGDSGDDEVSGGDGDDSLEGADGADLLTGGEGSDYLSGGLGLDVLTGGIGDDVFAFQSISGGADEITDFVSGSDRLRISAEGFGGGLSAGGTVSLVSGTDPAASEANGQFLYDTDDGRLFWDSDGTGSAAPELVATLSNIPALTPSDFFVVP